MTVQSRAHQMPHECPYAIVGVAEHLLDIATELHFDNQTEETFSECRLCGEWEGHTDQCPIPALKQWMGEP